MPKCSQCNKPIPPDNIALLLTDGTLIHNECVTDELAQMIDCIAPKRGKMTQEVKQ